MDLAFSSSVRLVQDSRAKQKVPTAFCPPVLPCACVLSTCPADWPSQAKNTSGELFVRVYCIGVRDLLRRDPKTTPVEEMLGVIDALRVYALDEFTLPNIPVRTKVEIIGF